MGQLALPPRPFAAIHMAEGTRAQAVGAVHLPFNPNGFFRRCFLVCQQGNHSGRSLQIAGILETLLPGRRQMETGGGEGPLRDQIIRAERGILRSGQDKGAAHRGQARR